jgi:3-deoxy-D-manno-octulosonic-acid transferase
MAEIVWYPTAALNPYMSWESIDSTSAKATFTINLAARRAQSNTTHLYAPLDRTGAVRLFFEHWRPDLGVFVESEIWPNLILAAEARGLPLALVNARMSPKSLRRWRIWPQAGGRLLRAFAYISAADARTATTLSDVTGNSVPDLGNLKLSIDALRVDASAREALAQDIGERPLWLAASTHQGEDEIALAAHERLRADHPNALLIIYVLFLLICIYQI